MKSFRDEFDEALLWAFLSIVLMFGFVFMLMSCSTTKYVPVVETNTEQHTRIDTVEHTDTFIDHQFTVIREADSTELTRLGILYHNLQGQQKAWLIERDVLQKEVSKNRDKSVDTVFRTRTVPEPYPVPAELTAKEKTKLKYFDLVFGLLIGVVCICPVFRISK